MSTLPTPLVSTDWLAEHLDDADLRLLDATIFLAPPAGPGADWTQERGDAAHAQEHIPGSRYADLVSELSADDGWFTRPEADAFKAAVERLGVGDDAKVVVYDRAASMWAARVWWLLRSYGFDAVAVLDGGFARWKAEGRPTTAEPTPEAPAASFTPRDRPELVADRDQVLAAVNDGGACLINSLTAEDFTATSTDRYARPGRIPGSLNVPVFDLLAEDGTFRSPEQLRPLFADVLARDERKITYCGGGIAATGDALALYLLGETDVAVYDGSLREWAGDEALPLEVG
ncbi:sulfurtransferase [Solirubrobacter sp. CPCC 204708]|uniref:Sulfurtransferase n=1 Tax=Solirubrobacter deserti TaxID=2282478 RepID=A0ABT4RHU8_9ACTN|nr:sulfurtransferase [Solirubrobacter deserti]MBE2316589.1 sulfurtransferase [Solirubrobacter deserti]MDA0138121.1 sulfurtransferase [Solirubrobacter deserti]